MVVSPLSRREAFWHSRHSADASIYSDLRRLKQQNELHLTGHQHYKRPISAECTLTLSLVCIRCDTLALFVFQLAAGGGNADHAKWHVAEMQKNTLELYLEMCFFK